MPKTIRRYRNAICALLLTADPRPVQMGAAIMAVLWGGMALLPWIDTFPTSPTFQPLLYVAPEWAWGAVVFLIGLGGLTIPAQGPWAGRWAILLWSLWLTITVATFLSRPTGLGWGTYGTVATGCLWALLRWFGVIDATGTTDTGRRGNSIAGDHPGYAGGSAVPAPAPGESGSAEPVADPVSDL